MAAQRTKIISFINSYLSISDFKDMLVNGLLVEGKEEIQKIVTAVSPNYQTFKQAIEKEADMIIAHHGLFFAQEKDFRVTHVMKKRLKLLLDHDINFAAYHLPLDAHPEIGNNIAIVEKLGLVNPEPIDVGFKAEAKQSMNFTQLVEQVEDILPTKAYVLAHGKKKVKKICIITGGASSMMQRILHDHPEIDVYICGDVKEHIPEYVRDAEINFINAGHYNTEKFGVQNLGKLLEKEFGVKVEFVDVPNEV